MKTYNEEIKVLADFRNRHVLVESRGINNIDSKQAVKSSTSTIWGGFVKDFDVRMVGKDASGQPIFDKSLYIVSESGQEVELPYDDIITIDVLSSEEQAKVEEYLNSKDKWELEIVRLTEMLNGASGEVNEDLERIIESSIKGYEYALEQGEGLFKKGVKAFK